MILDFASASDYVIALLPECILTLGAFAVLLVDVFLRGRGSGPSGNWVVRVALVSEYCGSEEWCAGSRWENSLDRRRYGDCCRCAQYGARGATNATWEKAI